MKKKLLSIFLSLSLIFSSIASMSVSFAEENSSTEKVVQQDGIEVRMDMKAGTCFNVYHKWGNYDVKQKFANGPEMDNSGYNGWQIMKVVIDIPKKDGLIVDEITPMQNDEGVPQNIKNNYPDYFVMKEYQDKYSYNYYFLKNGEYKFKIKYTINGATKETVVKYEANDLVSIEDFYMRVYLIELCNKNYNGNYEDKYLTKTFLSTVLTQDALGKKEGFVFGNLNDRPILYQNFVPKIESIDGIQYFTNNLKEIRLSGQYGFNNLKSISHIIDGKYEVLDTFEVTEKYDPKPTIKPSSYTPELITECIKKMPNLEAFYCEGTGFNDFTVFRDEYLGKRNLNDIWCGNNGVTSIEGIEKHNLNHIGIHNTTAGKNAGLAQNGVFDLTPLKNSDLDEKCLAVLQEIDLRKVMANKGYEDYKVSAVKENDKVKIELPMPIDIDGKLTDVGLKAGDKRNVTAKYDKETKEFEVKDDGDKKYIEIDNTAFGGKVVDDIENIEFSFKFNNDSGVDERTKGLFNGVVNFKASFNPTAKKEYRATYDFKSITEDKGLPESVTELLPVDNTEYNEGDTITAIKPNDEEVEDGNGKWIFRGYDSKSKVASKDNADENNNIKFVGKWEYVENEAKKYKVSYEFINATNEYNITGVELDKLTLPNEITKLLPNNNENNKEYSVGEEVDALKTAELKDKTIVVKHQNAEKGIDTYLEWKFDGYYVEDTKSDKLTIKKDGENKFVGKWICKDVDLEEYKFESDSSKELPYEISKLEPETSGHLDIATDDKVEPEYNGKKEIKVSDGTWNLVEWKFEYKDKEYDCPEKPIKVHDDVKFIGVWHFTPNSTGGGGTITPTPNPNPTPDKEDPDRVEGDDRIETSIEASEILYPNGTNAVVLANAERFSDVLTANPFAVQEKASALLTYKDKLPEKTLKEIERLGAKKIYVSGGYEAVSKKVVDSLAAKGYEIYRFDGLDRYDTARKIAIKIREKGNKEVVELASGENYPDALCMTSMAVKDNAPILLTRKDSIPKYTKQALAEWDIESVKIGGLDEAISKDVQNQIDKGFEITKGNKADSNVYDGAKKVSRFGGKDRYETSTIIAANSYPESKLGVYATGEDFPDALIAGNYAGRKEAPVLLVKRDTLPEPIEKYTKESKIKKATIIGGVNAVSDKVFNLIKAIINR